MNLCETNRSPRRAALWSVCACVLRRRFLLALACLLLWSGCKVAGESCLVRAGEPLITVAAVRDSASGVAIPVVRISDIHFHGSIVPDLGVLVDPSRAPVMRAVVEGPVLRCTVVCGFAASSGEYRFTVTAPGYASRVVTVDASYARLSDACPKVMSAGPRLSVALAKL